MKIKKKDDRGRKKKGFPQKKHQKKEKKCHLTSSAQESKIRRWERKTEAKEKEVDFFLWEALSKT